MAAEITGVTRTTRLAPVLRLLPAVPLVFAGLATGGSPGPELLRVKAASGNVRLANSLAGGAILSAASMTPGDTAAGSITIANSGDTAAAVTLSKGDLHDTPGPGGGRLSHVLWLTVDDAASGRRAYSGPISAMGDVPVSPLGPGAANRLDFTVSLDAVPSRTYSGAVTDVRFDWGATALSGGGSGDGTTTTPPPGRDTRPPLLKLTGKAAQKAKSAALVANCDEACTIRAAVTLNGAGKGVRRPKPKVKAPAGGRRATVKLVFDKRSLTKLRRGTLTVVVTATDAAGNRAVATKRINLKR